MSVVERAFEIARDGKVLNLPELKATLMAEGFKSVDVHAYLNGNSIRFQLMRTIEKHRPLSSLSKRKTA